MPESLASRPQEPIRQPRAGSRTVVGSRLRRWQTHQGVSLLSRGNIPPFDHFQTAVVLDKLGKLLESCCQSNYRRAAAVT